MMNKFEMGVFEQTSGDGIENSTMLFRTMTKEWEIGVNLGRMLPLYIYSADMRRTISGTKWEKGHLLYCEDMTISDIGELVFTIERGMDLNRMTAATQEELVTAFVEVMRELVIGLVDQEM